MTHLLRELNQSPIAYFPVYRKITGSTTAGLLLSQLMYWFSKKNKFYKTDEDIMEETLLTVNELRTAKKKLKSLGFITISIEGIPAKTYYKIDWEDYETSLVDFTKQSSLISLSTDSEINETNTNTTTKTSLIKEEEVVSFSKQNDFINYLKLNFANVEIGILNCTYKFTDSGLLYTYKDNQKVTVGKAKSLYKIMFENQKIVLDYLKNKK